MRVNLSGMRKLALLLLAWNAPVILAAQFYYFGLVKLTYPQALGLEILNWNDRTERVARMTAWLHYHMWAFPLAAIALTVFGCFMPLRGRWKYVRTGVLIAAYAGSLWFCLEEAYLFGKVLTST